MKPLIEAKNIEIEYNNKTVLDINKVEIYPNQRIGVVGKNGSGKTTLIKILAGVIESGHVSHNASIHYLSQNDFELVTVQDYEQLSKQGILHESEAYSGGEKMRIKLADAFSNMSEVLFLDEPTNNLDNDMKESLKYQLMYYPGTIVLVSHDRNFLNDIVEVIWEISNTSLTIYPGNYDDYENYKNEELERQKYLYEGYQNEIQKFEKQKNEIKQKAEKLGNRKVKKTESSGRLSHAKGNDSKQKNLNRKAKEIEKKIGRVEKIEKVKESKQLIFTPTIAKQLHNSYPIRGVNLNKSFGSKTIFSNFSFSVPLNSKIGIIGPNGSGKTTLVRMIIDEEEGIELAQNSNIGYFKQDSIESVQDVSAISYLMENQVLTEAILRSYFANLGFEQNQLQTSMRDLSGGEVMKLVLGKLLLSESNIIILDEPTNNLDIESVKALELMLRSYPGTVLIISHDERLIEEICDDVIMI